MASKIEETVAMVASASTWDARVQAVRRIPELHGTSEHSAVYAAQAQALYVPHLSPQFAYVSWPQKYELEVFERWYEAARSLTQGFTLVDARCLAETLQKCPQSLLVFRTMLGYTSREFAVAAVEVAGDLGLTDISRHRVERLEDGAVPEAPVARACAVAIERLMKREMWEAEVGATRSKVDKPDTRLGWTSVRRMAEEGVPYEVFLHQRHYGGAFRQLLDATSSVRGDALEQPLAQLFEEAAVPYVQTGSHNQSEIGSRLGVTVHPAPDFVVYGYPSEPLALIECKQANDGGTARDKAARFRALRQESNRLGGIPLIAVIDGLGWERLGDALGPVVRDTDGRVFTLSTLTQMMELQPFPRLTGTRRD